MQIALLHLSDIHLREDERDNTVLDKFNRIVPAIKSEILEVEQLFIVVTGDVAFSGKENEYLRAVGAFDSLSDDCVSELGLKPFFLLIPGNHDCDFQDDGKVRRILLDDIKNGEHGVDDSVISQCCLIQDDYREFAHVYESGENFTYHDQLFASSLFVRGDVKVVIHQFNSAWVSELHEIPGRMVFPIGNYESVLEDAAADLVISMIHHPYNWYQPDNGRKIRSMLERHSDIIFTGHEHITSISVHDNLHGQHVEHVEGGVLQEYHDPETSEFNLLRLNLQEGSHRLLQYHWSDKMYMAKSSTEWVKYTRSEWQRTKTFQVNEKYQGYLSDPGLTLNHPRKTKLSLEDTFIYPDVRIINRTDRSGTLEQFVNLENVFSKLSEENKYIIIGEEKSGKTTLCKVLYMEFYTGDTYLCSLTEPKSLHLDLMKLND